MNKRSLLLASVSVCALNLATISTANAEPSKAEMWKMIQQQQQQIEALQKQVETTDQKTEIVAEELEEAKIVSADSNFGGGWWEKTSLGGYGELHYNNYLNSDDGTDEIDFHRFVLFVGHEFNDDIRLFTELELEHSLSGDGKPGEVELEQAFIEFDLNDYHQAQAGLFLLPVGLLNERHEPNTFFGVERNPIEKNIIPTTWWEAGIAAKGELGDGFSYFAGLHSGLNTPTTGSNAFKIRSGRQKVAEAIAEDGAVTAALRYTGVPGLRLGLTGQYQSDVTQDTFSESTSATMFETHMDYKRGPWGLRALYARWDLDGNAAEAFGRDEQFGFYVEPSYTFGTSIGDVGVFTRYNQWDNEAGNGTLSDGEDEQWDVGMNYWPHENVVLKADIAFLDEADGTEAEILNLGVGYQF